VFVFFYFENDMFVPFELILRSSEDSLAIALPVFTLGVVGVFGLGWALTELIAT
jgi:hypothetical protein